MKTGTGWLKGGDAEHAVETSEGEERNFEITAGKKINSNVQKTNMGDKRRQLTGGLEGDNQGYP